MPGALRSTLLLLVITAAAVGVWALLDPEQAGDAQGPDEDAAPPTRAAGGNGDEDGTGRAPPVERDRPSTRVAQEPGIPRVLPPDAAIEDVRDALSLEAEERADALADASLSIGRIAKKGGEALRQLRDYNDTVEDPVIRGVVVASLGTAHADEHARWLRSRLEKGASDAERLGALIALADPSWSTEDDVVVSPLSGQSKLLGGLDYFFSSLSPRTELLTSVSRFLDDASGELASNALPVLLASVQDSPEWAALLVVDGERMCTWYASLQDDERAQVRDGALSHESLPRNTRPVIEKAE